jgi:hypothetical protein
MQQEIRHPTPVTPFWAGLTDVGRRNLGDQHKKTFASYTWLRQIQSGCQNGNGMPRYPRVGLQLSLFKCRAMMRRLYHLLRWKYGLCDQKTVPVPKRQVRTSPLVESPFNWFSVRNSGLPLSLVLMASASFPRVHNETPKHLFQRQGNAKHHYL